MANDERRQELISSLQTDGIEIPLELTLSPAGKELRVQELRESLLADGIQVDAPTTVRTPVDQQTYQKDVLSLNSNMETRELGVETIMQDTASLKENAIIIPEDGPIEKQTYTDVLKEMKNADKIAERLPVFGSIYKIGRMTALMEAVEIMNKPIGHEVRVSAPTSGAGGTVFKSKTTQKDKDRAMQFIEKWVADLESVQSRTVGGKFASALLEMPSFIVEFMLTGPLFKTGSVAAKATATRFLGKMAEGSTKRLAIRAAGAGFGSLVRTGVMVPKVLEGTVDRMTKGLEITDDGTAAFADAERNPWRAVTASFTDLYIENLSEIAGGAIGEGLGGIVKFTGKHAKKFPFINKVTEELADAWIKNAPKGITRTLEQFLAKATTKVGFNGILGEFAEERLGDIMRAATGLQEWGDVIISKEDALIEAGIFMTFGGVNLASEQISRKSKATKDALRDFDSSVLTKEREQEIKLGTGNKPSQREMLAFLNLGAGQAEVSLFDSAKNQALAAEQNKDALAFIKDRASRPLFGLDGKLILPGQGEAVVKAETDIKILNAATKAKAIDGNAKEAAVTEPAGPIKRAIVRNIARAEDAIGTWGKTGIKVQKDLREISFRTAVNTGNTTQNIKPWVKGLSKAEKTAVAQLIDGAISTEGQPNRLIQRANAVRTELDNIQQEALNIGLRTNELTGRAFPQVLNKEGKALLEEAERDGPKSSAVFAWAQNQIKDGKADNIEDAIIGLQQYREGIISGKEGYIEGSRTLEIGNEFRDWNLDKILSGTIESSWEKIEAARQWGVIKDTKTDAGTMMLPFKNIQVDMAKIRVDVGKNEANALNEYLKAQYGLSSADTTLVKIAGFARTTQFVEKLAFSPLTISRNILDRYAKGLSHGTFHTNARATIKYPPFMNNWMKSARNIEDQMTRSGAVMGHGHLSEGFTSGEGAMSFIAKPFASSEKGNQTYIALVKKLQLEADVKRLMELDGRDGPMSKVFDTMATIVGQSQSQTRNRALTSLSHDQLADAMGKEGQISPEVMSEVLHRTVTDSTFPLTLASKRLWWGNKPIMQAAAQFKVWSADQTRFIYKDVIKYGAQTGDWSRFARFTLATWLMGEMYNISRDFMLSKDESVLSKLKGGSREEIITSIGKDLIDGGVVGFLSDFTYGIGDWAAGPTVNSLTGIATAIDQASGTATLPEALGQFLLSDAPALKQVQGVMDRLDREFLDEENNLTENYSRWQGRSFDFRKKQGESAGDIVGNGLMRSLRGTPSKKVSERSLSLNMIARQVLVGDYDDAAKHIKRVMNQTKPDKLDSVRQSFTQSMLNNSPWGNIAQDKLALFFGQFSPEEVAEVLALQQKWLTGYQTSMNMAMTELLAEGFEEKKQAEADAWVAEIQPKIDAGIKVIEEAQAILDQKNNN